MAMSAKRPAPRKYTVKVAVWSCGGHACTARHATKAHALRCPKRRSKRRPTRAEYDARNDKVWKLATSSDLTAVEIGKRVGLSAATIRHKVWSWAMSEHYARKSLAYPNNLAEVREELRSPDARDFFTMRYLGHAWRHDPKSAAQRHWLRAFICIPDGERPPRPPDPPSPPPAPLFPPGTLQNRHYVGDQSFAVLAHALQYQKALHGGFGGAALAALAESLHKLEAVA